MRSTTKVCFDNILDTMTGLDGGVKFTRFKFALKDLDKQAAKGDKAAEQLIQVVMQFSRLIDATTRAKIKEKRRKK